MLCAGIWAVTDGASWGASQGSGLGGGGHHTRIQVVHRARLQTVRMQKRQRRGSSGPNQAETEQRANSSGPEFSSKWRRGSSYQVGNEVWFLQRAVVSTQRAAQRPIDRYQAPFHHCLRHRELSHCSSAILERRRLCGKLWAVTQKGLFQMKESDWKLKETRT